MKTFELFIGRRYLRTKKRQAFIGLITMLSIAGVTVGVMALMVVIAVMTGFEAELKNRILGVESHVLVMHHGGGFTDHARIQSHIEELEGVVAATPFILTQVMLRSSYGSAGVVLRGIDTTSAARVISMLDPELLQHLDSDQRPAEGPPPILLGQHLARKLGVRIGDQIYVIAPRGTLAPIGHLPAMRPFRVAGRFESGMQEYDSSLAYIALPDAQRLIQSPQAVTGIEVRIRDIYSARQIAETIDARLGYPYWTRDWMQMNQNLFAALKLERTVMFIILALIILVAAFNIASTLIMMVMEKTRDIAILKAMGATDRNIRRIFIFKGMTIGVLGTLLGMVLGVMLCTLLQHYQFIDLPGDIYYITKLPVQLKWLDTLVICLSALLICFLATLYPARQASRLNPVDALRYG